MARYRLSRLAEADLLQILRSSEQRWGAEAKRRYGAIVAATMRKVADDPEGPTTKDRRELLAGIRSIHLRHARLRDPEYKVKHPVHVLYYRVVAPDLVEFVRVLHERMEPSKHIGVQTTD